MIELRYEDRLEAAYQEGRAAALSGSEASRFTPGTPMHASWLQGHAEALSDGGWQRVGDIARRIVGDLKARRGD